MKKEKKLKNVGRMAQKYFSSHFFFASDLAASFRVFVVFKRFLCDVWRKSSKLVGEMWMFV
jgi:hypothetical protein